MDFKELNLFIEEEVKRLEDYYSGKSKEQLNFACGLKVSEELGELLGDLLALEGFQSKRKLEKFDKENLKKEFADVLITVLILANRFNINIDEALKMKIDEIKKRVYK